MSLRILRAVTWLLSAALVLAAYAPGRYIAARGPAQIADTIDVVVDGQVMTGAAGSGAPAKLQYFVANNGTVTATNVVLTVTLPANVFVVSEQSSAGWNCANSKCTYAVGSLAPAPGTPITSASSATLYVNIPPDSPNAGDFLPYSWHVADDGAHGPDQQPGNNVAEANFVLGLRATLAAQHRMTLVTDANANQKLDVDDTFAVTITVQNTSTLDARLVRIRDPFDSYTWIEQPISTTWPIAIVAGSLTSTHGTKTEGVNDVTVQVERLASGGQVTVSFLAKLATRLNPSIAQLNNHAYVDDIYSTEAAVSNISSLPAGQPVRFDAVMQNDRPANAPIYAHLPVHYTVTVTNTGEEAAPNLALVATLGDSIAAGDCLDAVIGSVSTSKGSTFWLGGLQVNRVQLGAEFGAVVPGEAVSITFKAEASSYSQNCLTVATAASLYLIPTGSPYDPSFRDFIRSTNAVSNPVQPTLLASMTSSVSAESVVFPGQRITYTILLTNVSPGTLPNVYVNESTPPYCIELVASDIQMPRGSVQQVPLALQQYHLNIGDIQPGERLSIVVPATVAGSPMCTTAGNFASVWTTTTLNSPPTYTGRFVAGTNIVSNAINATPPTPTVTPTPKPPATATPTPSAGTARIVVRVDAQPDSIQNFRFDGDLGSFRLDDASPDDGDTIRAERIVAVAPGTHVMRELVPNGWTLARVDCDIPQVTAGGTVTITVGAGQTVTCTFVNLRLAITTLHVWHDANGDKRPEQNEQGLANWRLLLVANDQVIRSTRSNSTGYAWFGNLVPGGYRMCLTLQSGWENVLPAVLDDNGRPCYWMTVPPGYEIDLWFGNRKPSDGASITPSATASGASFAVRPDVTSNEAGYDGLPGDPPSEPERVYMPVVRR